MSELLGCSTHHVRTYMSAAATARVIIPGLPSGPRNVFLCYRGRFSEFPVLLVFAQRKVMMNQTEISRTLLTAHEIMRWLE